eukprot:763532-Hanusia_phi.AAC.7
MIALVINTDFNRNGPFWQSIHGPDRGSISIRTNRWSPKLQGRFIDVDQVMWIYFLGFGIPRFGSFVILNLKTP